MPLSAFTFIKDTTRSLFFFFFAKNLAKVLYLICVSACVLMDHSSDGVNKAIYLTASVAYGWSVRRNKNRLLYKLKNLHLYSLDMDTRKRFGVKISFCKCVSWTIFTFLAFLLSSNCKILYFQYNSLTLWKFIEITIKMISGATLQFRRYVTLYINYLLLNFTR